MLYRINILYNIFFLIFRMKIHLEGVHDDLFTCLWVAKRYPLTNLKAVLEYENSKGITNPKVAYLIKQAFRSFETFNVNLNSWERYETFFDCNFAVIAMKTKKRISFKYKSQNWENMIFLRKQTNSIDYININIKEILPLLTKEDSFINLPINDIFQIYGISPLNIPLTDATHKGWEDHAKLNIQVYQLINGAIKQYDSLISLGRQRYSETIRLIAKDPAGFDKVF